MCVVCVCVYVCMSVTSTPLFYCMVFCIKSYNETCPTFNAVFSVEAFSIDRYTERSHLFGQYKCIPLCWITGVTNICVSDELITFYTHSLLVCVGSCANEVQYALKLVSMVLLHHAVVIYLS